MINILILALLVVLLIIVILNLFWGIGYKKCPEYEGKYLYNDASYIKPKCKIHPNAFKGMDVLKTIPGFENHYYQPTDELITMPPNGKEKDIDIGIDFIQGIATEEIQTGDLVAFNIKDGKVYKITI